MSLDDFLNSRGLQSVMNYFKEEKIEPETILLMKDEDLKSIIPKYGDRVAINNFCRKYLSSDKKSLIQKLKEKLGNKGSQRKVLGENSKTKSLKKTRLIEIGWMSSDNKIHEYRQVRSKFGGGTRKIQVSRDMKCADILAKAKELFFPNGVSTKGNINLFTCELLDFKSHKFDLSMTVQEMYECSAMSSLRFYLATCKNIELNDDENSYIPSTITTSKSDEEYEPEFHNSEIMDPPNSSTTAVRRSSRLNQISTSTYYEEFFTEQDSETLYARDSETLYARESMVVPDYSVFHLGNNIFEPSSLPDVPLNTIRSEKLTLHRGNVFEELMMAVKIRNIDFDNIQIEMILPNGKSESAEDIGGVLRDSLSEFFNSFYELCTMGADFKVPSLRHDYQQEEWSAIGKIISQSFQAQEYFPIKIAPVFIKDCLKKPIDDDEVLDNFFKYISYSDATLLKNSLENFDETDFDELLEFCNNYDARCIPNKDSLRTILVQIAKEELIQKPSFVKNCFAPHLNMIKDTLDLKKIYSTFQATDKNIIAMLEVDENLSSERKQVVSYLKKYIKECDQKTRSSFLRFCTGSDLANQKIKLDFNNSEGFLRVPIAHTCSRLLEISTTYENFMSFRSEFNQLLNSNIWVMDIVYVPIMIKLAL